MTTTDDHADTQAGATALAFPALLSGQLGTPQDKDVFKVQVTKGRTYVFSFVAENAQGDPVLKGWTDGHADAPVYYSPKTSALSYAADYSGDYYLEVGNRTTAGTAGYKLVAAEIYPDDYPTPSSAGTLPVGGHISAQIEVTGDLDWFKVYLQRGVKYAFTLEGQGYGKGTMPVGATGAKVFLDATPQSPITSRLLDSDATYTHYTLAAETSGYHYLAVYDDAQFFVAPPPGFHTGTYTLHAALVPSGAGGSGNDILAGLGSGTVITGGAGLDTTVYAGARATYAVTQAAAAASVTRTGASGGDSLTGVERLLFDDVALALDVGGAGAGGQAYRLYQAAFNRAPDKAGIGYWIAQMDKGASIYEVAQSFIYSDEYQHLYGATSSDFAFISQLYQNVLHRTGDQPGIAYWSGVLASGVSRPAVLASFSESMENQAAVAKIIGNGFEYTPYG
jgi:hypothetical protein